jgi:predicted RNA-binding protein (virulence factor B family)
VVKYHYQQTKGQLMSAKTYSIETLLEGKFYRSNSRNIEGIIQEAEIANEIWYGENLTAFRIRVRPNFEIGKFLNEDFWATIAVKVGE